VIFFHHEQAQHNVELSTIFTLLRETMKKQKLQSLLLSQCFSVRC